jgi:hypothetical protein
MSSANEPWSTVIAGSRPSRRWPRSPLWSRLFLSARSAALDDTRTATISLSNLVLLTISKIPRSGGAMPRSAAPAPPYPGTRSIGGGARSVVAASWVASTTSATTDAPAPQHHQQLEAADCVPPASSSSSRLIVDVDARDVDARDAVGGAAVRGIAGCQLVTAPRGGGTPSNAIRPAAAPPLPLAPNGRGGPPSPQ